ncbi:hypothetical protein [Prevotella sp.]
MKVTIMKKANFKSVFSMLALSIVAGSFLVGCSNSEDLSNELTPKEGMGIVSFSIDEKDYETSENVTSTRAAAQSQPEIQDLGDGWQAEVSLVPDTTHRPEQKVATRAIYGNKHYTIRAYQGSTLKGEIKGTFNGNNFTPDAGDPGVMQLPHGYYDFVCFNDYVTANGTTLSVNRTNQTNAYNAFYTIERGIHIYQDPKQKVSFTAKHAVAMVDVELQFVNCEIPMKVTSTRYVFQPWGGGSAIYNTIEPQDPNNKFQWRIHTGMNDIPEEMLYDFVTNTYTYPSMGQISSSNNKIGGEFQNGGGTWDHMFLNTYYLLPSTNCSKLKFTFDSGELYGRSLTGKSITVPTHKLVEANKRYKISIRLIMENMYLFSDGTKGFLDKNPGKTAIGVILSPMYNFAVALKDVKVSGNDAIQWSSTTAQESSNPVDNYKDLFNISRFGTVSSSNIAMQAAQNMFGLRATIPALYDFLRMGSTLGKMADQGKTGSARNYEFLIPEGASATGFYPTPSTINFPMMDKSRFDAAFTRVNGDPMMGSYWTNTECKDGSEYKQVVVNVGGSQYSISLQPKNSTAKIRPIIWF